MYPTSTTVLAVETSCDDTAAALCRDGVLLAHTVKRQSGHAEVGGVVPELASRQHQGLLAGAVQEVLTTGKTGWDELSAVACTTGPGLIGALWVGVSFAKGVALAQDIPLVAVDHLHGHLASLFLSTPAPEPHATGLCLIVSGGHTMLVQVTGAGSYHTLGQTRDDAAGEALDKCGKLLGLPYPAGPELDRLARTGHPGFLTLPKPEMEDLDFSFSGLKTAFLYKLRQLETKDPDVISHHQADLAASLELAVVQSLVTKLEMAAQRLPAAYLGIVGGVSANTLLRAEAEKVGLKLGLPVYIPPPRFSTDNAAMIALAGYHQLRQGVVAPLTLEAYASQNVHL